MTATVELYQPGTDPRPDLILDSDLWAKLLRAAWLKGEDDAFSVFWCLQTVRCLGASLTIIDGRGRIRAGEMPADDYADLRERWLRPRLREITEMLEAMG